jgi:ATP-binding cassette, subfamily B, multidrug efflux pump
MMNPYFAGKIVDKVIYGHHKGLLFQLLGSMVGVTIVKTVIRYNYQLMFEQVSQSVIFKIREKLYDRLHQLDFPFYDKTKTGDIMARMTGDLEAVRHFTAWVIYVIFENLTILLFAIGFMFYIHPPLALAMLAITPVIGFFAFRLHSRKNYFGISTTIGSFITPAPNIRNGLIFMVYWIPLVA